MQHQDKYTIKKDTYINVDGREIIRNDKTIPLTTKEFDLIYLLLQNKGRVFSRDELLDRVWGYDYAIGTRSVDIHILRLRKKIGDSDGSIIKTVFGVGYKME